MGASTDIPGFSFNLHFVFGFGPALRSLKEPSGLRQKSQTRSTALELWLLPSMRQYFKVAGGGSSSMRFHLEYPLARGKF